MYSTKVLEEISQHIPADIPITREELLQVVGNRFKNYVSKMQPPAIAYSWYMTEGNKIVVKATLSDLWSWRTPSKFTSLCESRSIIETQTFTLSEPTVKLPVPEWVDGKDANDTEIMFRSEAEAALAAYIEQTRQVIGNPG